MERVNCTEECLTNCDILSRLGKAGVTATRIGEILADAAAAHYLPAGCPTGKPIPSSKPNSSDACGLYIYPPVAHSMTTEAYRAEKEADGLQY